MKFSPSFVTPEIAKDANGFSNTSEYEPVVVSIITCDVPDTVYTGPPLESEFKPLERKVATTTSLYSVYAVATKFNTVPETVPENEPADICTKLLPITELNEIPS